MGVPPSLVSWKKSKMNDFLGALCLRNPPYVVKFCVVIRNTEHDISNSTAQGLKIILLLCGRSSVAACSGANSVCTSAEPPLTITRQNDQKMSLSSTNIIQCFVEAPKKY